ncbi:MAG TPA: hypothetical protein VLG40_04155 [Candidatus Saccharimonas sp.]|nr:hypothetical protein [Candidatus Saccharimonas sp.]
MLNTATDSSYFAEAEGKFASAFPPEIESYVEPDDPSQYRRPELEQPEFEQTANFTHHGNLQAPLEATRAAELATPAADVIELRPAPNAEQPAEPEVRFYSNKQEMIDEATRSADAVTTYRNYWAAA